MGAGFGDGWFFFFGLTSSGHFAYLVPLPHVQDTGLFWLGGGFLSGFPNLRFHLGRQPPLESDTPWLDPACD